MSKALEAAKAALNQTAALIPALEVQHYVTTTELLIVISCLVICKESCPRFSIGRRRPRVRRMRLRRRRRNLRRRRRCAAPLSMRTRRRHHARSAAYIRYIFVCNTYARIAKLPADRLTYSEPPRGVRPFTISPPYPAQALGRAAGAHAALTESLDKIKGLPTPAI